MRKPNLPLACAAIVAAGTWSSHALVYKEVNGVVCVEAEHFDSRTDEKNAEPAHRWLIVPDEDSSRIYENARGGKYMAALPDAGQNRNTLDPLLLANDNYEGPTLNYKVEIKTTGEYRLWLRAIGFDGASDSMFAQIVETRDGEGNNPDWWRKAPLPLSGDFASMNDGLGWDGSGGAEVVSGDTGGDPMLINITKAGTYTIRVLQREDGLGIDALVLQLSSKPDPAQDIPESPVEGIFVLINKHPKNLTIGLNGTATLTVDAVGSSAVSYQWQKAAPGSGTFTDIAGATSASYTSPALAPADSGSKYRVKLSVTGKEELSKEATVVVDTTPPSVVRAEGSPSFDSVRVLFTEAVSPATAGNKANYTIQGLAINSATVAANGRSVVLSTAKQTSGTTYNLTVKDIEDLVAPANKLSPNPTALTFKGAILSAGAVGFDVWTGIGGNAVALLTDDPKYAGPPDFSSTATSLNSRTVYPDDSHEAYGGRMRAILTPTESGDYRFFLGSDDSSQLFLNRTGESFDGVEQIAEETGCCNAFTEPDSPRTSEPITLQANKQYAIQVIWKEGGGGDYAQVAWRKEGSTTPASALTPIPGRFLSWYVSPDVSLDITQHPASVSVTANAPFTLSVRYSADSFRGGSADVQWQKAPRGSSTFADIPGATGTDYSVAFADPADDGAKYRAIVSIGSLASRTSSEATVTVGGETIPPKLLSAGGSVKSVNLTFNEPLDPASAGNKANYTLSGAAKVDSATVVSGANLPGVVQLGISGATGGKCYTVTVNGVKDRAGNVVRANSQANFAAYTAFYDFNTVTVPAGTQIFGNASIEPANGIGNTGVLQLTPSVNSLQGGFLTPDLAEGGAVNAFTFNFKIYVGQGSGNPADGYSFNFSSDVPEGSTSEEGAGSGIIVAFDTYDNGNAEAPAIDIKYAGTEVASKKVTKATLVNNKYVDVSIRLAGGKLTVVHDGVVQHDAVTLPDFAPVTGGRFLLGARTGGEREVHWVDDIAVLLGATAEICPVIEEPKDVKFSAVRFDNGKVVLEWSAGTLQSAAEVTGPYTNHAGAASPSYSTDPTGARRFFRLVP